ncbi:MAG: MFS transporter [Deinococcota bacterium]
MARMRAKGLGLPNRDFRLGVYNGILINGAEAFFHSSLVLAPFLAALGAPAVIIGLIPALRVGGWLLPQLLVASRLAHRPFKLPWYKRLALVRVTAYSLMVLAIFVVHASPQVLVWLVLAMIAVVSFAGGISGIPFADVTAKVIPHYRLGTFWVLRNVIGGVLALIAGIVLRRVLASDVPFPQNFAVLFAIGTVLSGIAYIAFCSIREPAGKPAQKEPFRKMVRRIPGLLKEDVSFRRYLRVRFLALLALLADPFYAVYAIQLLDAPTTALGLFVIVATFSTITANLLFRRAADSGRNVSVFQIGVMLLVAAPLTALVMTQWQGLVVVFVFSAAGQAGINIAAWNLLYAVSPEAQRPLYVGTANSLLSLPSLAPILAGGIVDGLGFQLTFAIAACVALLALSFAFRFQQLRVLDQQALQAG